MPNMYVDQSHVRKERRERREQIFKEIMAKTFPNMVKDINLQIQAAQ